jgi:hypothetical protein
MSSPHPAWGLARIGLICLTLLGLQLITATSWDLALDGEAGTLGGVGCVAVLMEFLRRKH